MPQAIKAHHETDPREVIWQAVGKDIDDIQMLGARVLVATYVRPDKTASGIYLSDRTRGEDEYQGRVGMVLKMGPLAFVDDENHKWGDLRPKIGYWIFLNIGDARRMTLNKHPVRIVEDVHIAGLLTQPDVAW